MKRSPIISAAALAALTVGHDPSFANDTGSGYAHGQLYFANDSRFNTTHFSEPLTTYAVGWRDPADLESALEFVAPSVAVGRRFEWRKATNDEEFYSELVDDERAIGADFKRVQYQGTMVTDKTLNKGLTYIVDLDNVTGTGWEQMYTAKLLRRLYRNEYRRALAALSAAATNTAKTWNSSADPDQDVMDELQTAADITGVVPNRVLYGITSWLHRSKSYRAQNNAGGYASAQLTESDLAGMLGVSEVRRDNARYTSATSTKTRILGNKVLMFMAEAGQDTEDPSHIKRFVTDFSGDQGAGRVRVYRQELSSKLVAITVEHYSKVVITHASGIRQFTTAAA